MESSEGKKQLDISILGPVYNEAENLERFHAELFEELEKLDRSFEIVYVDDGSRDSSREILTRLAEKDERVKVISFTRNFGQTAAVSAAINHATGAVLITIDTDLQNDPADIKRLLDLIDEGYDVVSGWRKDRKDPFLSKKLPSFFANWMISVIGGLHLHDYGCSLKAYRREVLGNVRLYGEMHRFIPLYAQQVGAEIIEIPVNHRPRTAGKSNYGLTRIFKVILDLFTVKFMGSFIAKPAYLFGSVGGLLGLLGVFFGAFSLYDRYILGFPVHNNPKILLAVFLAILGFQFIMMGLLAELIMRTYFESQDKQAYFIKYRINLD